MNGLIANGVYKNCTKRCLKQTCCMMTFQNLPLLLLVLVSFPAVQMQDLSTVLFPLTFFLHSTRQHQKYNLKKWYILNLIACPQLQNTICALWFVFHLEICVDYKDIDHPLKYLSIPRSFAVIWNHTSYNPFSALIHSFISILSPPLGSTSRSIPA